MRLTVQNHRGVRVSLPGPVNDTLLPYETNTYTVTLGDMEIQSASWSRLRAQGIISWTTSEDPSVPDSIESTPYQVASTVYKPLVAPLTGVAAGTYYLGGGYDAPAAEANLDQTPTVATLGTANNPYGAKVFIVAGAAGTTDAGVVGVRVAGTSLASDGTRTPADTEVLSADITSLVTDQYIESTKRWIGQVTVELYVVSGLATTYALDVNYGFADYDTMDGRLFTLDSLKVNGLGGAVDAGFDIEVLWHEPRNWTYSAAAFAPGSTNMVLAQFTVDCAAESDLAAGDLFGWLRDLGTQVRGAEGEGIMLRVTTTAVGSVEYMQAVLALSFA
jgi:hypothetical protein